MHLVVYSRAQKAVTHTRANIIVDISENEIIFNNIPRTNNNIIRIVN